MLINKKADFMFLTKEDVESIEKSSKNENSLYDVAELFKVFGDLTRVKILHLLEKKEMCVLDISGILEMSQSAISHQLRILKNSKLVKFRRYGKTIFYSLSDEHVKSILAQGLEHVEE